MLAKSGYFMGHNLSQETESNAITNFEDIEVNRINEALLAQAVPKRPRVIGKWVYKERPVQWQRWLARVPLGTEIPAIPSETYKIKKLVGTEPYCFKDPRLSYVLPVWRPLLKDNTVFICVFRDPVTTAQSMLKLSRKASHLQDLKLTFEHAIEVWTLMYQHIIELHRKEGEWLFLHHQQTLTSEGLERLRCFTGANTDSSILDSSYYKSLSINPPSYASQLVYQQLCNLAGYQDASLISQESVCNPS
ncbi:MAG: hypothetical protein KDJ65_36455 [Anaerolineae bacterium]|nr:hypothetical protein [Anaerolineae bacterium]